MTTKLWLLKYNYLDNNIAAEATELAADFATFLQSFWLQSDK